MDQRIHILFATAVLAFAGELSCSGKAPRESKNQKNSRNNREERLETTSVTTTTSAIAVGGTCELDVTCRGDDGAINFPIKLPIKGPRGHQGSSGEKGARGEDGLPGLPGIPGLSAPIQKNVAFFAGLSRNIGPVVDHADIVFDAVVTNIGSAYDGKTGRFTAPVNGTYQFNVIISAQGRQRAAVKIMKNSEMIATVWAESIPYWATASNVVVLSLDRKEQVYVMLINKASYLHGYMYTTFSGFLIFEN